MTDRNGGSRDPYVRLAEAWQAGNAAKNRQNDVADGMFRLVARIDDEGLREDLLVSLRVFADNGTEALAAFTEGVEVLQEIVRANEPKRLSADPADYLPEGFEVVGR